MNEISFDGDYIEKTKADKERGKILRDILKELRAINKIYNERKEVQKNGRLLLF